jgi:hypothetical protein
MLPETKGKTLEEIQELFHRKGTEKIEMSQVL